MTSAVGKGQKGRGPGCGEKMRVELREAKLRGYVTMPMRKKMTGEGPATAGPIRNNQLPKTCIPDVADSLWGVGGFLSLQETIWEGQRDLIRHKEAPCSCPPQW